MHQRNCRTCSTNFLSKHKDVNYCSRKCSQKAYRERAKEQYPGEGGFRGAVERRRVFASCSGIVCWRCNKTLIGRQEKFCGDRCRMAFNRRERQADGVVQLSPLMRRRLRDVIFQQHQPNRKRAQMAYPGFKRITRDKWHSITKGNAHTMATAEVSELADSYTGVLPALGLRNDLDI